MPSLSPLELITVAVIALVVFGPNKLPEFARNVGQFLAQMRRISDDLRSEFSSGMSDFDVEDEPEDEEAGAVKADGEDAAEDEGETEGATNR
ncbi:hypothetical protein BH18ACT15_BH18ACT15_15230 [soil metagenome]